MRYSINRTHLINGIIFTWKSGPSSLLIFTIHCFLRLSSFGNLWKLIVSEYLSSETHNGTQQCLALLLPVAIFLAAVFAHTASF